MYTMPTNDPQIEDTLIFAQPQTPLAPSAEDGQPSGSPWDIYSPQISNSGTGFKDYGSSFQTETITDAYGNILKVTAFEDGIARHEFRKDPNDTENWHSITTTFDENGEKIERVKLQDNGIQKINNYENGNLTTVTRLDNVAEGDAPQEGAGIKNWHSITTTFDENGEKIERVKLQDNGIRSIDVYENGMLIKTTQYDNVVRIHSPEVGLGVEDWHSIKTYYDESGTVTRRDTDFDNGVRQQESFDDGTLTWMLSNDRFDFFDWALDFIRYDEQGNVISSATINDNETHDLLIYDEGEPEFLLKLHYEGGQPEQFDLTIFDPGAHEHSVTYFDALDIPTYYRQLAIEAYGETIA